MSSRGVGAEGLVVRSSPAQSATQQLFTRIWACMGVSLLVSACSTVIVSSNAHVMRAFALEPWLGALCIAAQLAMALGLTGLVPRSSTGVCAIMMLAYAAVDGIALTFVFQRYGVATIAAAMFTTSATFALTAAWAAFTGRDPAQGRSMLGMLGLGGVLSLVVAMVMPDQVTTGLVCAGTVLTYAALAATDVPRLRTELLASSDIEGQQRAGLAGALMLHLDFATLFIQLFRALGTRRESAPGKA